MPAFFAKSSKWYSAMDSSFHNGRTFGARVQAPSAPGFKGFRRFKGWRLTGLRPEGCGRLMAAGCVPTGETTHYDLCVASAPSNHVRCASLRSGGDSACGAEGCGLPSRAMLIKSALRDWLSMSYGMISILRIGSLRSPPPIRLRRTSPCSGGRIGRSMLSCRDMVAPWLSIHSAPACGGKVVAPATKGGKPLEVADRRNAFHVI